MDRYVELVDWLSVLSKRDQEDWREIASLKCACTDCPSYTCCAKEKGEGLFCLEGRTKESIWPEGTDTCRCVDCSLALNHDFTEQYYCVKGSEGELRSGA